MASPPPKIRWAILGTGWVSTRFSRDLLLPHPSSSSYPPIYHTITAIGTSNPSSIPSFLSSLPPLPAPPEVYTYDSVFSAPNIDVIYIGTPHSLHKAQCLSAIAAGKAVLCEKPFCINSAETEEVITAARKKDVFIMEAVWTRFFPLRQHLHHLIHEERVIGNVKRMFCDFGIDMKTEKLPETHRYRDLNLGAGAWMDLGVYPLALANVVLDGKLGKEVEDCKITTEMLLVEGVDLEDVVVLKYPDGKIGILTASLRSKSAEGFCRIEGTDGVIVLEGPGASLPERIRIQVKGEEEKVVEFGFGDWEKGERVKPMGFRYEADAVGWDVLEGRRENVIMPLAETVRMMGVMDEVRRLGGVVYPQDKGS